MACLPQVFRSLVDRIGLGSLVPVEYFGSKNCEFLPDKILLQKFEVRDFFSTLNICCYLNLWLTVFIALLSYIFGKKAFLDLFHFFSIIHTPF